MSDTLSIVRDFLKERLDLDPARIPPQANLKDLGIDSLMVVELLFEFEEKLGLRFPSTTATPGTVGELLALVESLRKPALAS